MTCYSVWLAVTDLSLLLLTVGMVTAWGAQEYLPIGGNAEYCKLARQLILGRNSPAIAEVCAYVLSSVSTSRCAVWDPNN